MGAATLTVADRFDQAVVDTVTAATNLVVLKGPHGALVIQGSPAELLALAERIRDAVHAAELAQMTETKR